MKYVRSFDRDLFAGSVLKCTAGDMGLIPVLETEFHMLCGASKKKKKKKKRKKKKKMFCQRALNTILILWTLETEVDKFIGVRCLYFPVLRPWGS